MTDARSAEAAAPRPNPRPTPEAAGASIERAVRIAYWLALALTIYGSLYPFAFAWVDVDAALIGALFASITQPTTRGDLLGNIVLFLPVGFLGTIALDRGRGLAHTTVRNLAIGLVVAAGVQVVQLYIPDRAPALNDVVWNALGLVLGAVAAMPPFVRSLLDNQTLTRTVAIPAALIALMLIARLYPFVPTIDFQAYKNALKPLLLAPEFGVALAVDGAIGWLAVGAMIAAAIGDRRAGLALAALVAGTLCLQVVIVENVVTATDVVAAAAGVLLWALVIRRLGRRELIVGALMLAAYVYRGFEPFSFQAEAGTFHWIPFTGSLTGSMSTNARVIAEKIYWSVAILWLLQTGGARLGVAVIGVTAAAVVVESAQVFLAGRTAESTDIALMLAAAWAMKLLGIGPAERRDDGAMTAGGHRAAAAASRLRAAERRTTDAPPAPRALSRRQRFLRGPAARFGVACLVLSVAMYAILNLPGIPYNVAELFGGDNAPWRLFLFSAAVFWIGTGGSLVGRAVLSRPRPYLVLPVGVIAVALISYVILRLSVTIEALGDITGSQHIHYFVVNRNIWGDFWAELFKTLDSPVLIGGIEAVVRYLALYCPFAFALAVAAAAVARTRDSGLKAGTRTFAALFAFALPWVWLCKLVVFDYSSTDNLNELIARPGPLGIGGEAYLYLLICLIAVNAVAAGSERPAGGLARLSPVVLAVVGVPVGWWLLNAGTIDAFTKYGVTYSGVDFLLGPDRREKLPEAELIARWTVVYLGAVAAIGFGVFVARSHAAAVAEAPAWRPGPRPADSRRSAPPEDVVREPPRAPVRREPAPEPVTADARPAAPVAAPDRPPEAAAPPEPATPPETVRLRPDQVDFLDGLARQMNVEPSDAVARIIDWFIDDCHNPDPSAAGLGREPPRDLGFGTLAVVDTPIRFRADHRAFLDMVAQQSGASVSRTTRQIIDQFSVGL